MIRLHAKSCRRVRRLLAALHDCELRAVRRLRPAAAHAVEMHVEECPRCAAELAAIRRVSAALSACPEIDPSPDFDLMVFARLAQRAAAMSWADRLDLIFAPPARRLLAAALLSLAIAIMTAFWTLGGARGLSQADIWEHLVPVRQVERFPTALDLGRERDAGTPWPEEVRR